MEIQAKSLVQTFISAFILYAIFLFHPMLSIPTHQSVQVHAMAIPEQVSLTDQSDTAVQMSNISSIHTATERKHDRIQVIPGGQSIGVQLHTKGVLVVGHHLVEGDSQAISPGEDANIQVGDMIIEMNGQIIERMNDVKPIVEEAGKKDKDIVVILRRNDKNIHATISPQMDQENKYQIGLYIRDSAAGIGTMSFYEPQSQKYGALGHVISDVDTQKPIETYKGTIVRSSVTSIAKGNNGIPGEKKAQFSVEKNQLGNVNKNSPFGVFGVLDKPITNGIIDHPLDVAFPEEVKNGPATILTVLEDEEVEQFDIEIISSVDQSEPATKGMVIKITDERLLDKTGGVVQGMSGSPIIQNGKVIGAVTHVFVNDPTSGYGVHIEWMLEDAGIISSTQALQAS